MEDFHKVEYTHEDLLELFDSGIPTEPGEEVVLSEEEIAQAKRNKSEMRKKASTFANTPLYRTFHSVTRMVLQIMMLAPKKYAKVMDVMISSLGESMRWCAAAYHHEETFLKLNSIEETISIMYEVRIFSNVLTSQNFVGKHRSKQLSESIDSVMRQLVAWRSSTKDEGFNDANTEH